MHDPNRLRARFQGGRRPREGDEDSLSQKEARLGDLCLAVGSLNEALAYYKKALSQAANDDPGVRLEVILKASACLRRQGKSQEALSFVESVGASFEERYRRDLLVEKATLLCLLGRYGEAARVCEEAQQQESSDERQKDAGVYLVLGHVLARLCKWEQAIVCLEQAATFGRMCGDIRTLGNALNNLGIVHKNLCRFRDSARFLKKAVKASRQLRDDASLSVRLLNLANTYFKQGNIEKADAAVSECLKIASNLNIARTRLLASICKARVERVKGNSGAALRLIRETLAEAEIADDPRLLLVARETLAELLAEGGDLRQATGVLEDCLAALSPHTKDVEAEVKSRLAEVYLSTGKREQSSRLAAEAARVAEDIGDLYEAGRALRCMAAAGRKSREPSDPLGRAERIFRSIGAKLELGITLRVKSHLVVGDAREVEACLRLALSAFETCKARKLRIHTLCDLAATYMDLSEHAKALTCVEEARLLAGDDPADRKLVSDVRLRVDGRLAKRLTCDGAKTPSDMEAAFELLRTKLGAGAVILSALDAGGPPKIIKTSGISHDAADRLARAVSSESRNPYLSTDMTDLTGRVRSQDTFRSLLAVRFGQQGQRGLLITCWSGPEGSEDRASIEASHMVRAYYEIRHMLPALEPVVETRRQSPQPICIGGMVTSDDRLKRVLLSLSKIADSSANVLITGETGTGKELVARAIHALSPRKSFPLVVQNCAALPEQLLESELFGHRAGAFTGAKTDKKGLLEVANGGTFFLDEVGDVSPAIQAKMLRSIETGEIRRVGDTATRPIDARFLSATNKNLEEEVERGRFRRDLYYRLNVVSIHLPPLRERTGDIELLTHLFLSRFAGTMKRKATGIRDDAMRALAVYDWPGNVRQLENEIEKAVTLAPGDSMITPDVLSACITGVKQEKWPGSLKDELRMVERRRIVAALNECGWNKTHAARKLGGLSRPALIAKMKRLGIPLRPG